MSEEINKLQRRILSLIISVNRRPSSIAMILRRTQSEYNQNMVVQALIDLEKRGLVERTTSKAWIAKASASSYLED